MEQAKQETHQLKEKTSQKEEEAMAAAASAAIFAFLAHPISLLRHLAHACAGYLGLKALQKPSSSSAPAAAACYQQDDEAAADASEDCTAAGAAVVQVRSRGFTPPERPRSTPVESIGGAGGRHH